MPGAVVAAGGGQRRVQAGAVGFEDHPCVVHALEPVAAFVQQDVVAVAQQGEVVGVGEAAVGPVLDVVGVAARRRNIAAGPHAAAVTGDEDAAQRLAHPPGAPPHIDDTSFAVEHGGDDFGVAGHASQRRSGEILATIGDTGAVKPVAQSVEAGADPEHRQDAFAVIVEVGPLSLVAAAVARCAVTSLGGGRARCGGFGCCTAFRRSGSDHRFSLSRSGLRRLRLVSVARARHVAASLVPAVCVGVRTAGVRARRPGCGRGQGVDVSLFGTASVARGLLFVRAPHAVGDGGDFGLEPGPTVGVECPL